MVQTLQSVANLALQTNQICRTNVDVIRASSFVCKILRLRNSTQRYRNVARRLSCPDPAGRSRGDEVVKMIVEPSPNAQGRCPAFLNGTFDCNVGNFKLAGGCAHTASESDPVD
ncbi:hypothetical protein PGT21_031351 [Puccinia graminis f. sp. tritici]|uniref:Uncharacterized protein n=1 Tax=Puccinia graminis f. sp. tritici TaxID=56615 RepID=A0A5B0NZU1_PUCGR|nr:hypothetical protein PGTUg99_011213 [Puccinia graminis f. sp. tritici]KAA1094847.1 hypothetical protein PGT21_031351 [Puccinia graminis f. sp. tritici]